MLRLLGYQTVAARDGQEALDCYRRHGSDIDLLIIDLVMPRMDGRECLRAVRELDPGARAVITTGYGYEGSGKEFIEEGVVGILKKPYRLAELSGVVARALERGG